MAPKGILKQWQAELYEKFNLVVPIYDGESPVLARIHHHRQMEAAVAKKVGPQAEWAKPAAWCWPAVT